MNLNFKTMAILRHGIFGPFKQPKKAVVRRVFKKRNSVTASPGHVQRALIAFHKRRQARLVMINEILSTFSVMIRIGFGNINKLFPIILARSKL